MAPSYAGKLQVKLYSQRFWFVASFEGFLDHTDFIFE
jgi:hypothetical protein